jgi:cytochrome c553
MFPVNNRIASGLILLFTVTAVFAITEDTSPITGRAAIVDDSANSIKLRSGRGDPVAGMEKSQLCQGCHGEFGNSTVGLIPKLAGQYANYIAKQVHNYQAGTRSHQIMNAMAGTINEEDDLADIAAYFASQNKMKGDGSADNKLGKDLFLHGDTSKMRLACINCHGARGKGADPKISSFPVIGGQHKDYIRKQLTDFRSGFRTNSPNGIMNTVAKSLTDAEIEALAEYVSQF